MSKGDCHKLEKPTIRLFENSLQGTLEYSLVHGMNILVGSDRQTILDQIIYNLVYDIFSKHPEKMINFDICSGKFQYSDEIKALYLRKRKVVSSADRMIRLLKRMKKLCYRRHQKFKVRCVRTIVENNQKMKTEENIKKVMPYKLLIIDTSIFINAKSKTCIDSLLTWITHRSRSVGVNVIILTTKPASCSLDIQDYFLPNRVSFRLANQEDSTAIFGDERASSIPDGGWCVESMGYSRININQKGDDKIENCY